MRRAGARDGPDAPTTGTRAVSSLQVVWGGLKHGEDSRSTCLMRFVFIWWLCGMVAALLAWHHGCRSMGWGLLHLLGGPWALVMGLLPSREGRAHAGARAQVVVGDVRTCPSCAATIWVDKNGDFSTGPDDTGLQDSRRYVYSRAYFRARYGETFTETDLWRYDIPTFEEYGEWTSVQAHAFAARLLRPAGFSVHPNYLRVFTIDSAVLRAVGVRYILTDAEALDEPSILRGSVSAPDAPTVRLFELINPNLGTYSPMHFVKAVTADEIVQRIRENKDRLDQVAIVTDDVPPTTSQARNVEITIERDGIQIHATSDGPAHILLPVQFSHCLVVVNGAAARLTRANLFQTPRVSVSPF